GDRLLREPLAGWKATVADRVEDRPVDLLDDRRRRRERGYARHRPPCIHPPMIAASVRRRLETDVAVPGFGVAVGVVAVGHDAYGGQKARLLAERAHEIGVHV